MRVTLNMAISLDGRVAGAGGVRTALSSPEDLRRVHHLRAESECVLVGIGTVLADDPSLTARTQPPAARQPLRVVLDSKLRTPPGARVVDDSAPTIIFSGKDAPGRLGHAEVVRAGDDRVDLQRALKILEGRGIQNLLVEGGPQVARSFLAARRVGLMHLFVAPTVLGTGPSLWAALEGARLDLVPRSAAPLGTGMLLSYGVGP